LDGRVDLKDYYNAARTLENWLVLPHGGITRRPGTRFVAAVKFEHRRTRLIAFRVSTIAAYMLEVGHEYIRFYRDGGRIEVGGVPVEVATPYTEDQLEALKFDQTADVLSWAHQAVPPSELLRFSHVDWIFRAIAFDVPPSREYGSRPNATLTLSAVTGTGVTATASSAAFEAADVGRDLIAGIGRATITGYTNQTTVTVDVTQAFATVGPIGVEAWRVDGSPLTQLTPSAATPAGAACTLTATAAAFRNHSGDTDVGKFVLINGGTVEITGFSSATVVTGRLRGNLNGTTPAPAGAWSLEEPAWSSFNGYPAAVASFEARRWWAGTPEQPQTLWGSKTGDLGNYALGVLDDDGISYTIAGSEVNAIRALVPTTRLFAFTIGEEHVISGSGTTNDNPITPGNVQVRSAGTNAGVGIPAPLRVGNVILVPSPTGKKLNEFVYSFEADGYVANDMLTLSEHLTAAHPITQLAHQKEPDQRVWATTREGPLLVFTYLRAQAVAAWTRLVTQGVFESVAVIPADDGTSEVWTIVRRTINGATRRYVEVFDLQGLSYASLHTDAVLTYDGAPATTISGLGHLENMTVKIVADGAVHADRTVSAGAITLDAAASRVEVGLGYASIGETLRPEVPVGGTSQTVPRHWSEVVVRLQDTLGLTVAGQPIPFRRVGDPMDTAPPLYTGDKRISRLGWDKDGRIAFTQDQPLPATILMIAGTLDSGI
jgi:hypothetical protein